MPRLAINVPLAIKLRSKGLTWDKVAEELSSLHGRYPPFQGVCICRAVIRFRRKADKAPIKSPGTARPD